MVHEPLLGTIQAASHEALLKVTDHRRTALDRIVVERVVEMNGWTLRLTMDIRGNLNFPFPLDGFFFI